HDVAKDGEVVAALLSEARWGGEVRAVFTANGLGQLDEHNLVPHEPAGGARQIPEYEGASLGYQQPKNNGVMWYLASVDTSRASDGVKVDAIPVIDSLALKPVDGLTVARSSTLRFEAVGRRPPGSLATTPRDEPNGNPLPGYDNYVEI